MTPKCETTQKLEALLAEFDADTREEFHERAGIMEYDGGLAKIDAERSAWRIVVKKDRAWLK